MKQMVVFLTHVAADSEATQKAWAAVFPLYDAGNIGEMRAAFRSLH